MTTTNITILSIPDDNPNNRWYQCYLSDNSFAGRVKIQCESIDKNYLLRERSTIYQVPNYVPNRWTPDYILSQISTNVETIERDNSRNSTKW